MKKNSISNKRTKRQLKKKQKKNKTKKYNRYKKYFNILTNDNTNITNIQTKYQTKKKNKNNKIAIVLIYADWCGHCQLLRPVWNEFIQTLDKDKYDIIEINSEEQEEGVNKLKRVYNVDDIPMTGFPTIGHIYRNTFYSYNDGRDLTSLKSWITNMKN